jgi:uncharacterized membrane protein
MRDNTSHGNRNKPQDGQRDKPPRRPSDVLPNPEILEAYNYIVDGSAKIILTMFEKEQTHRHEWEMNAIKTYRFSTILGQILGFLIAVSVFVSATIIGIFGDSSIAAFIWVFGMAIVVMAGLVWAYAKSMGQRPLFARPAMRAHFRPEKETDSETKDS